ncbi:type II toxin-antitoxin system RelE/ParE family toxin [Thauera sp. SDU_THAU2]|uniref:type II toxin-antitoxin system RelE/ParE family toxin n=1 Tax=Thauera sp. SDU_THAU2 TaxID=3136633 RepID=UPI00311DE135
MTRPYIYSQEAATDLRQILNYTTRQWGAAQARAYARQIDDAVAALAAGQGPFKDWGEVLDGLRVKAVGSHYIFGIWRGDHPALILAILHERMDLMARIKARLR